MATDADWLEGLPRSIRQRFDGLGNYISGVLDEGGRRGKLKREQIQEIHIRIFIQELRGFLMEGSYAAARAVDAFESLGVRGFRIGSEIFEGRNVAVTRGWRLAEALTEATGTATSVQDDSSQHESLRDQILRLAREVDERRVD